MNSLPRNREEYIINCMKKYIAKVYNVPLFYLSYKIRMVCMKERGKQKKNEKKKEKLSLSFFFVNDVREITLIDTYAYAYRVSKIKRRPRRYTVVR